MKKFVLVLIAIFLPLQALAVVRINEIAWMGTVISANDEWIELYNDGSANVALDGWTLTADDGQPNITLQGTIAAGSFFLLERTDDESVPNVIADQIYTGALGNSGETLTLRDTGGAQVDVVAGGDSWKTIGGDNATKQTAQRSASGAWVTADPTPRAATIESGSPVGTNNNATDQQSDTGEGGAVSSTDPIVWEPDLYANAGEDRETVAGATLTFTGRALGSEKEPIEKVRFLWNFGDGSVREGASVMHSYTYPGEYTVVMTAATGITSESDRVTVRVGKNALRISEVTDAYVAITNGSVVAVHIGGWSFDATGARFTLPHGTEIGKGAVIRISSDVSGIVNPQGRATLNYPNGTVAASYSAPAPKPVATAPPRSAPEAIRPAQKIVEEPEPATTTSAQAASLLTGQAGVITIGASAEESGTAVWWLIAAALGVVGGGGVFAFRKKPRLDKQEILDFTIKRK